MKQGARRNTTGSDWSHNAIYYGLDVATFCDGNGDGVGDFIGLRSRLDYLRGLGVSCLWLIPFYRSPGRDNGYDVVDHRAIDPRFGSMRDFDEFLAAAHAKGLRVMIDLVANHTSDAHPWFQAARRGDPRYRMFYHWTHRPPPKSKQAKPVFPTVEDSVWTYDPVAKAYYFHRHYAHQPDLNVANEEVQQEIGDIIAFWAGRGVDGFRIDSLTHLFEKKSRHQKPDPRRVIRAWRRKLESINPAGVLLGEADVRPEHYAPHFGDPGAEVDLLLNFYMCASTFLAFTRGDASPIHRALKRLGRRPWHGQWANFLRNLDELDLEHLSPEERQTVLRRFAPKPSMRAYNRGARRRVAPMLEDEHAIKLAWTLLFSLPGVPLFVYGDELAMGEDLRRRERHSVRLPMPWSERPSKHSGICWKGRDPKSRRTLLASLAAINARSQLADPSSFLHWFRGLTKVRHQCPEVASAPYRRPLVGADSVLALEYRGTQSICVYHNLGSKPQRFDPKLGSQWQLVWHSPGRARLDAGQLHLGGFGYAWFRKFHSPRQGNPRARPRRGRASNQELLTTKKRSR